jgi:hypothetical protein
MAAEFTPLFPALKANQPTATGGTAFLYKNQFAPAGTTASETAKTFAPSPHAHRPATIDVKRDGQRISQIRVQCRCGEVIEIDCEY